MEMETVENVVSHLRALVVAFGQRSSTYEVSPSSTSTPAATASTPIFPSTPTEQMEDIHLIMEYREHLPDTYQKPQW